MIVDAWMARKWLTKVLFKALICPATVGTVFEKVPVRKGVKLGKTYNFVPFPKWQWEGRGFLNI